MDPTISLSVFANFKINLTNGTLNTNGNNIDCAARRGTNIKYPKTQRLKLLPIGMDLETD